MEEQMSGKSATQKGKCTFMYTRFEYDFDKTDARHIGFNMIFLTN